LPNKPGSVLKGPAVDFCIFDLKWATKYNMFPINYGNFYSKYHELFYARGQTVTVEEILISRFLNAVHRQTHVDAELTPTALSKIYRMKEREPIHYHIDNKKRWVRKMYWPELGILTHHDPREKRRILKELKITHGDNIQKLLKSNNLKYYNRGFISYQNVN